MNERIRELAEQATSYTWNGNDVTEELDEQKFAELMVKECVQTLIDNTPERYTNESAEEDWDKGYDRAMEDSVQLIRKHFGVEP